MKQITLALAILGVATSILDIQEGRAADPYSPVPADTYEAPAYAFTGFGLGIDGGGQFNAWDYHDETYIHGDGIKGKVPFAFDGISSDGLIGGAHLEYLFGVDRWRFGAYGEGGFSNVNTTFDSPGLEAELRQDSYYGAGLKAGVTVYGSTLVYARTGYEWSQWTYSETGADDVNADVGAWLVGGGIETMVSDNWSLGLGGDYLILHDADVEGDDVTPFVEDSEMLRIKARLTRRF